MAVPDAREGLIARSTGGKQAGKQAHGETRSVNTRREIQSDKRAKWTESRGEKEGRGKKKKEKGKSNKERKTTKERLSGRDKKNRKDEVN